MVLKEDITPLVGGLDFDVIKQDTKKLVLGVRKLLHKTPESREKGVQLVKEAVASSPSLANSTFINNTLMNYIRENPVKSAGYATAVATLAGIGVYGANLARKFIQRWQWADSKAYNIIKHAQRPGSTPFLDYWYLMQHFLVKGRAPEAPKFNMMKYLDENYGQTPAWKWMKHGKIMPSGVQRKPSSFVRALPFITAGVVGAAAIKQQRMRNRQLTYKNAVDAFNARLDKLWDSGDKVGYYKLLADLSDYLPKK